MNLEEAKTIQNLVNHAMCLKYFPFQLMKCLNHRIKIWKTLQHVPMNALVPYNRG